MTTIWKQENGQLVGYTPFNAEWVRAELAAGRPVVAYLERAYWGRSGRCVITMHDRGGFFFMRSDPELDGYDVDDGVTSSLEGFTHTLTILPPLPRHPKPEYARLLHLYAAHGLAIVADVSEYADDSETLEETLHPIADDIRWEEVGSQFYFIGNRKTVITHALTDTGERVELAFTRTKCA